MFRRLGAWVVPALLCACGVDLGYPTSVRVACNDDSACFGDTKCSVAAHVCIEANDPDDSPRITSATATDSNHVVLLFSTPMERETLGRLATYTLAPDIGVQAVSAADDGTRVVLSTTAQRGRPYLITAPDLTDSLGRPLANEEVRFDGIGTPVNTTPPGQVFPPNETRLVDGQLRFAWTENADAATYTLEVARDAAFTDIVIRQTQLPATFSADLPGDDTYYWRVRSDISEPSVVSVFAIVGTGLHVYCAVGETCVDDLASFRGGDPKHPLRDPTFATAVASTLGLTTIRVARRGETALPAYPASLIVSTTALTVEGAYDATFTRRDLTAPTTFSAEGSLVRVANTVGTVLSGLRFQGNPTVSDPVVDIVASAELMLDHVVIMVGNSDAMAVRVAASGMTLTHVTIDGAGHVPSAFINSTVAASDSHFVGHPFRAEQSDVGLVDSDVTVTPDGDGGDVLGVVALSSNISFVRSSVTMQRAASLRGALVDVTSGALVLTASRVTTSQQLCAGCVVSSAVMTVDASVVLLDSLVVAGNSVDATVRSLRTAGALNLAVVNSTLVNLSGREALGLGTLNGNRQIDLVNSIVVGTTGTPCASGSLPATMRNVAFVGCSALYNEVTDVTFFNGQSVTSGGHYAGNIAAIAAFDTLFPRHAGADAIEDTPDDDYAPTLGGPFDATGSAGVECGSSDIPRACPASATDIARVSRANPPAIGAWEAR